MENNVISCSWMSHLPLERMQTAKTNCQKNNVMGRVIYRNGEGHVGRLNTRDWGAPDETVQRQVSCDSSGISSNVRDTVLPTVRDLKLSTFDEYAIPYLVIISHTLFEVAAGNLTPHLDGQLVSTALDNSSPPPFYKLHTLRNIRVRRSHAPSPIWSHSL